MADGQGFSSLSTQRKREISAKGGKQAQLKGTGHRFKDGAAAKAAALKGVLVKKRKQAQKAAIKLMALGFTPEELATLKLSEDEYIYFGGSRANATRVAALRERLNVLSL